MGKFLNTRSLVATLTVVAVIIVLIIIMRSCGGERIVRASVSQTDIVLGELISYADSTAGAGSWLWEFGNGDYSTGQSGRYQFPEEGRYQVRVRVNHDLEKEFQITVRPPAVRASDHLIRIDAPATAVQGEYVLFSAVGSDLDWRWEFGESGIIDSREKTAIYAYQTPGVYMVRLSTEKTQYPVTHMIEVTPGYSETDSLDAMTLAGNDIRQRLQNIADGKPFNPNYNHVLNTYLCNDPDVLVTVNNDRRNDFYSYCAGLRVAGRGTYIETVFVEMSNPDSNCIDHLIVLQYAQGENRASNPSVQTPPATPTTSRQNP
jgi:PKD repeat protein